MNTLAPWAQQIARVLLQEPLPADGRTSRASPTGHAAWHPFSARTPICSKPPRGSTTSATSPASPPPACISSMAPGTFATRSTPMPCCAGWSPTTPAPSSEAGERGLADVLSDEFDPAPDVLASVLTCCDMTTSPDGEPVPVDRRLAEIHDRYGPGHLVSRSIQCATPMILRAVEQVHQRAARTT